MKQPNMRVLKIIANSDPYLFEHLVHAEGLRIVGIINNNPLDTEVQTESVLAIASTLTEDAHDQIEMTRRQYDLKRIAENLGYVIALEEGLDQHPGTEYDPMKGKLRHPPEENPQQPPAEGEEGAEETDGAVPPQQ